MTIKRWCSGSYGMLEKDNGPYVKAEDVIALLNDITDDEDRNVMFDKITDAIVRLS